MDEISEVPVNEIGAGMPKASTQVDSRVPETTEKFQNKVDLLMVFGQGPVKPLLRATDLDENQKAEWENFKTDPLHNNEPDFRVLEGEAFIKQLEGLTEEQQQVKLAEWQSLGRFALNRWGRENALASGFALVSGYTDRVLLSGGKTIPGWAKEQLPPGRLEKWPSEAQLMAEIIKGRFGEMYQKKYGKSIDEVLILEDSSTNTLENLAKSINTNPDLLKDESTLGILATNFHLDRSAKITALFAPGKEIQSSLGAQSVLAQRNQERKGWRIFRKKGNENVDKLEEEVEAIKTNEANKNTYEKILEWMVDPNNPDLIKRQGQEARWSSGLTEPQYIKYWFGYFGKVEDPSVLQETIKRFGQDPDWAQSARSALEEVGLSFDEIAGKDLTLMPKDEFAGIARKLEILSTSDFRVMPPPVSD